MRKNNEREGPFKNGGRWPDAYSGFRGIKRVGVFLILNGLQVHCIRRGTMRAVTYPKTQHSDPGLASSRTARCEVQC